MAAVSGAATGILFFGLGEIISHLAAMRTSLDRAYPEALAAQAETDIPVLERNPRTPEQLAADIDRLTGEIARRG